jgi:YVTN family beta-propeller protein
MKQIRLYYLFTVLALGSVLASCHKDKTALATTKPEPRTSIYVLNQGGFTQNNSTLTYYDHASKLLTPDIFSAVNNSPLGDTGNDLGIYGSKMFIIVNNSNVIDVVNAKGAKLIKQINLYQPRSVVFYKNNALVTSYSGTVSVIDTASLTITKTITVGSSPEQMAIVNDKLYVANSGGLDYPDVGTTVSVVDLATFSETKKITVIDDPVTVTADAFGNIYVLSLGIVTDKKNVGPGMTIISAAADTVKSQATLSLGYNIPVLSQGDFIYYPTADNKIAVYNARTQTAASANFITDGTIITSPYAISGDPVTGEIFIADAIHNTSDGTLYAFDKNGKQEYTIAAGINPGKILLTDK